MNWANLQDNWTSIADLIALHFPYTDRSELLKLDGELTSLTRYLAETHDLTLKEAVDAVDFILLIDKTMPEPATKAA